MIIEFFAKMFPQLLKMFIEWKVGNKMSDEEYHAFITANKKMRDGAVDSTDNFKTEIARLKAEHQKKKEEKAQNNS